MSFAIFDSLFSILSEEIDVPVSKLKKAWDISLLKFFKTDPNVLAKVAPKLQQSKKPNVSIDEQQDPVQEEDVVEDTPVASKPKAKTTSKPKESKPKASPASEPKPKKTSTKSEEPKQAPSKEIIKLPNCDEANCTIKVKLCRPIDGKNYCSKHYQKHSKALAKKEGLTEVPKQQPVKELEKSDSEDEECTHQTSKHQFFDSDSDSDSSLEEESYNIRRKRAGYTG